ncbi:MAG TPA: L,D-transpeptidase [Noviherbaspirillum sp.]
MKIPLLALAIAIAHAPASAQDKDTHPLALAFEREVDRRVELPPEVQSRYALFLGFALQNTLAFDSVSQYVALVDRDRHVQTIMIYYLDAAAEPVRWRFIGASPVSTGKPGSFEHFVTPTGVYAHSLDNPDFRAEGTRNKLGVRGYGVKGMRVYDFGWVAAERGWGAGGQSIMRLQMHATDPDLLERRLGEWSSKGCIRIPAALNDFIDRYGLLDADYLRGAAGGRQYWVLRADRTPAPNPGRYLVVIDSETTVRPEWLPPRKESGRFQPN